MPSAPTHSFPGTEFRACGAPELRDSDSVEATYASDIWDLGVILAEILNGEGLAPADLANLFQGVKTSPSMCDVQALGRVAGAPKQYQTRITDCLEGTLQVHTAAHRR